MAVGLDEVLARRGRLAPGECVTVAAAVAAGLAVLHADARAHGDVRASRVFVERDGSVRLAAPVGTAGSPADDLAALGRLIEGAMDKGAPLLLRQLIATSRADDLAARPDAEELARLVVRSCAPLPVRVGQVEASPSLRRVAMAVVLGAAVLAAITAGRAWGGGSAPTGTQLPSVTLPSTAVSSPIASRPTAVSVTTTRPLRPSTVDWRRVVTRLDSLRAQAFARAERARLPGVDADGSPALRRDTALVEALGRRGVVARGWRPRLEVVTLEGRRAHSVVLRVSDRLATYTLVSSDGAVRHRVQARGTRWWRCELREVNGRWRIWDVSLVGAQPRE